MRTIGSWPSDLLESNHHCFALFALSDPSASFYSMHSTIPSNSTTLTPHRHLLRHRIQNHTALHTGEHHTVCTYQHHYTKPSEYAFGHTPPQNGYRRTRAAWEWLFNYKYIGAMTFLTVTVF